MAGRRARCSDALRRHEQDAGVPTRAQKGGPGGGRQTPLVQFDMLLTIKDVSTWLNIKRSTLYLWAAQGKIPCRKIHGLLRFERDAIQDWLQSFDATYSKAAPSFTRSPSHELDALIEAAKRDAYTPGHGETLSPSPGGKEDENGAR